MEFDWDAAKARANLAKHAVPFEAVYQFEFDSALIEIDDDLDYGEERLSAIGFIGNRIHYLVFTLREETVRVISLRRATRKEALDYVEYVESGI